MFHQLLPGLVALFVASPFLQANSHKSPFSAFHLETRFRANGVVSVVGEFSAEFTLVSGQDIDLPNEAVTIQFRVSTVGLMSGAVFRFTFPASCFTGFENSYWTAQFPSCVVSAEYIESSGMLPVDVPAFSMFSWMIRVLDEPDKFVFAEAMIFAPPLTGPDIEDLAALLNDPGAALLSFESHFGEAIRCRKIIPHIAIGDVWSTTLTFLNTSAKDNRIKVNFWSTGGMPLTVSATNETNPSISVTNEMVLTLLPRSSTDFLIAVPPGADPSTIITGWISVTAPADAGNPLKPQTDLRPIAGHAIFTNATPGQPIFEAVVPLKDPAGASSNAL